MYKEGRFSLDQHWFHCILDWAGAEFQPQLYAFADPRSTTEVKRPGRRAGVWVNTPKSGAAVTQGLNKPWHDDTIFVMCPHKFLQQVAEKAMWEGSQGIMIVPRHKNKQWLWGLSVRVRTSLNCRLFSWVTIYYDYCLFFCFLVHDKTPYTGGAVQSRCHFLGHCRARACANIKGRTD